MGDLNARVGRDHTVWQGVLRRHGVGNCNANECMLLELCAGLGLIITNSLFQQIAKFKTIWQHPRSWNTGTSWTTSSCARRTSVTCYTPESWPVLTATQTTGLQWGKEGYRCLKPTGCWREKFSSRKSSRARTRKGGTASTGSRSRARCWERLRKNWAKASTSGFELMEVSLISVASSPEKETTEELILELHTQFVCANNGWPLRKGCSSIRSDHQPEEDRGLASPKFPTRGV